MVNTTGDICFSSSTVLLTMPSVVQSRAPSPAPLTVRVCADGASSLSSSELSPAAGARSDPQVSTVAAPPAPPRRPCASTTPDHHQPSSNTHIVLCKLPHNYLKHSIVILKIVSESIIIILIEGYLSGRGARLAGNG